MKTTIICMMAMTLLSCQKKETVVFALTKTGKEIKIHTVKPDYAIDSSITVDCVKNSKDSIEYYAIKFEPTTQVVADFPLANGYTFINRDTVIIKKIIQK